MANEEQLSILKQGVDVWNKWREENAGVDISLTFCNLSGTKLDRANLNGVDLSGAILNLASFRKAHLIGANLKGATLMRADLSDCHLYGVNLNRTNLEEVYLNHADCTAAMFIETNLRHTDLSSAILFDASFCRSILIGANFHSAVLGGTVFGDVHLDQVVGLDKIEHRAPSSLGRDILVNSNGKLPEQFLRGCGLSDWEIEASKLYSPELSNEDINNIQYKLYDTRAGKAFQISPLFISYSHADSDFVNKISDCLRERGIRYWRDIHDMKSGRIETQIDRAIRLNPTVLLVLTENSLNSDWVEHEVRTGRELEKELSRDVLCPVALDDCWKDSHWPKRFMEQIKEYNILDFSAWKDDKKFDEMFRRLIDGLGLFYK